MSTIDYLILLLILMKNGFTSWNLIIISRSLGDHFRIRKRNKFIIWLVNKLIVNQEIETYRPITMLCDKSLAKNLSPVFHQGRVKIHYLA